MSKEEKILKVLERQCFNDFYNGLFLDYIEGAEREPSKEEVLKRISELFENV